MAARKMNDEADKDRYYGRRSQEDDSPLILPPLHNHKMTTRGDSGLRSALAPWQGASSSKRTLTTALPPLVVRPDSSGSHSSTCLQSRLDTQSPALPQLDTRMYHQKHPKIRAGPVLITPLPLHMTYPQQQGIPSARRRSLEDINEGPLLPDYLSASRPNMRYGQSMFTGYPAMYGAPFPGPCGSYGIPPVYPGINPAIWPYVPNFSAPQAEFYPAQYAGGWPQEVRRPDARLSGKFSPRHNDLLVAMQSRPFSDALADSLFERWLSTDIVPGVLAEVFIELGNERHIKGVAASHAAGKVISGVMDDIIRTIITSVIREMLDNLVESYITQSYQRKSVSEEVLEAVLDSLIRTAVMDVMKETLSDQVESHMQLVRLEAVAEDVLHQTIHAICTQEMEEAVSNQHSDDLLWDVYGEAVARQVNLVCREVVQEEFESLRQEQLGQVSDYAANYLLDKMIMEKVMEHLSTDVNAAVLQCYAYRWLDELTMKATLRRLASVQDAAAACEGCQPLSSIHNTLFHQAALESLVKEFVQHCDQDFLDYHLSVKEEEEKTEVHPGQLGQEHDTGANGTET